MDKKKFINHLIKTKESWRYLLDKEENEYNKASYNMLSILLCLVKNGEFDKGDEK